MFWGYGFYGVYDLLAFAQGPRFHAALMLSTGWGLLFLFLVAPAFAVIAVRPEGKAPALPQVAAVGVAIVIAAALSSSAPHLFVALGLALCIGALAALGDGRQELRVRGWRWRTATGTLVLVSVPAWSAYAWHAARKTGTAVVSDDTFSLDHWPIQSSLAIAIVLTAALASGLPVGWQLPGWAVGATVVWLAVGSWANPHLVGSLGRPWAAVALLWVVTFLAAAHVESTRSPGRTDGVRPAAGRGS